MKNKCVFKYNSGNLSLNCSKCSKIIKVGYEFTEEELKACQGKSGFHIPPQYCEQCKSIEDERNTRKNKIRSNSIKKGKRIWTNSIG